MTFTLGLLCGLVALGVCWVVSAVFLQRVAVRRRVVVNLDTGRAFAGVLWQRRGALIVLRDATLLERGTDPAVVDGEVVLDAARVEFVQVTGG